MAVTVEKNLEYKAIGDPVAFPVASGETIYAGTIAVIDKTGLLRNLSSTYVHEARLAALVMDSTANNSGPAATTSAGSISGSDEAISADAGDKTVRKCLIQARVRLTFTAIAQTDVGKTVYASDNYTVDETQTAGTPIGTLVEYISATTGWVMLNTYYTKSGLIKSRVALTAATDATAGAVLNWANPSGEAIIVHDLILNIATAPTNTSGAVDAGVAASATSNDGLIDGAVLATAKAYSAQRNAGSNGGMNLACTAGQYVTVTSSVATLPNLSAMVGTATIIWFIDE